MGYGIKIERSININMLNYEQILMIKNLEFSVITIEEDLSIKMPVWEGQRLKIESKRFDQLTGVEIEPITIIVYKKELENEISNIDKKISDLIHKKDIVQQLLNEFELKN